MILVNTGEHSVYQTHAVKNLCKHYPEPNKINPLFTILSSFDFGKIPEVCIFYDFHNQIWYSDQFTQDEHLVKK